MKPVLFYDTETTGLPVWEKPSDDPSQPRITQLCAELVDVQSREVLAGIHTLIQPNGWQVPDEVSQLTGITTQKCLDYGLPMSHTLMIFLEMARLAGMRVAHNESFDMRMVRIEILRAGYGEAIADKWKAAPVFCTCNASKAIVNLPPTEKMRDKGMTTPKPPNLGEAYLHFTGQTLEKAHNATVDVMALKAVYFGIQDALAAAA